MDSVKYVYEVIKMVLTDEIIKIRDIIVNTIPLEKLYLFGSYAYGTPNEDSDYDFYAVIPNDSMRPLDAIQKVYGAMWGATNKPMDVLAGTAEKFERRSKVLTIEKTISEKGVLLYDKQ
jgi:predicted nucleotidyltransferase